VTGGEVYVTRFSRALRRLPGSGGLQGNEYVMHWANPAYPSTPGRLTSILAALRGYTGPLRSGAAVKRAASAQGKYFLLRNEKSTASSTVAPRRNTGFRGSGIYTRKGKGQLELVYRILDEPFRVERKYDWSEDRIGAFAQEKLPSLILEKLRTL
jgi:hypothetical protein